MQVTIRLFAQQREIAGWRRRGFELPERATVADAWDCLVADFPALAPGASSVRFARNTAYVDPAEHLADGDELAIIPPVAGGAEAEGEASASATTEAPNDFPRVELHPGPFDEELLAHLRAELPTDADGALVLFVGQTRDSPGTPAPGEEAQAARFSGHSVEGLEYEAYEEMAIPVLRLIASEIEARFGVRRLAILHRVGAVPLGDASVVIGAAAPHRAAAFDACRYAIEELKARAPIWKSERFADGSVWVGAPARSGPLEGDGGGGSA